MGKLYIIGNGFDIDHKRSEIDFDTRYIAFMEYLKHENIENFAIISLAIMNGSCDINEKEVESIIEKPDEADFLELWVMWSNFEKNLEIFDNAFFSEALNYNDLILEENRNGDVYTYCYSLAQENVSKILSSYKELKCYFIEWIHHFKLNTLKKKDDYAFDDDDIFLSFNYTRTLEEVYNVKPERVCHIHGEVLGQNSDLIIGHNNKYSEEWNNLKRDIHGEIGELFDADSENSSTEDIRQIISAQTDSFFKDVQGNIENKLKPFINGNNIESVEVIGHSFGDVDWGYFGFLNAQFPQCLWNFKPYGKNTKNNLNTMLEKILIKNYVIKYSLIHEN